ncbi:MAG: hypothetical protein K1X92_13435 [Bacteroidia bacterium]|nr:hypothetical protein [Bacteroidia bacterium]
MLFPLTYIENHDIEKVHQLLEHFFCQLQTATVWDKSLFPNWYHPVFDKGLLFQERVFRHIFDRVQNEFPMGTLFDDENQKNRQQLYQDVLNSNKIEDICNDTGLEVANFKKMTDKDTLFRIIMKKKETTDRKAEQKIVYENCLIELWETLTAEVLISKNLSLQNIKCHYQVFCKHNGDVCVMCGMEKLPLPNSVGRANYDHYLDKVGYSISCVNPHNLIPIGGQCNTYVKGSKNMIIDEEGARCYAFYPYAASYENLIFSLDCSKEPSTYDGGDWTMSITPEKSSDIVEKKIQTWNRVFKIIDRYLEYIKINSNRLIKELINSNGDIINELQRLKDFVTRNIQFEIECVPKKMFYEYYLANPQTIQKLVIVSKEGNINHVIVPHLE